MTGLLISEREIGEGSYSKVHSIRGDKKVVLKKNFCNREIDFISNIVEIDILNKVRNHLLFVNIKEFIFGDPLLLGEDVSDIIKSSDNERVDNMHFLLEKLNMSLQDVIYNSKSLSNFSKWIDNFTAQILLSIEYLHSMKIVHRDIKPGNILITENNNGSVSYVIAKLGDFGMSTVMFPLFNGAKGVSTIHYRAPEIVLDYDYNEKIDVWSAGCVIYEMISLNLFIYVKDPSTIFDDIYESCYKINPEYMHERASLLRRRGKLNCKSIYERLKYNDLITGDKLLSVCDLLNNMLNPDPLKRYSASQCLAHPFLKDLSSFIDGVRMQHSPFNKLDSDINIISCSERKWISHHAISMYSSAKINPRIVFHSIALFDRYLSYLTVTNKQPNPSYGKYLTLHKSILAYYVCLYLSYKYFLSIGCEQLSWSSITSKAKYVKCGNETVYMDMSDEVTMKQAELLEIEILSNCLKFDIYKYNLIEVFSECPSWKPKHVTLLFNKYISMNHNYKGSVRSLFKELMVF